MAWLSHGLYTMLYKYGKQTRDFFCRFYFYFSPVFYIFGAFLIKELFIPACSIWDDYSQLLVG